VLAFPVKSETIGAASRALSEADSFNNSLATNNNTPGDTAAIVSGVAPSGAANLFPITDSTGMGDVDTSATTQFVSDSNIVSAAPINSSFLPKTFYDSSSDSLNQDIKMFLAKPVILWQGNLTTTDTFSTHVARLIPADTMFNSTIYRNKIEGFLGFRATTVIRIVINANRFQQGRYLLNIVPLGGAEGTANRTNKWVNDHLSTLVQRSTAPHVEIDLNCDTEATIRVPFNSALNFYPIYFNQAVEPGSWFYVKLSPYVPLSAVTGDTTCGFCVYAHFEDIQLVSAAIPQSGIAFSKKSRKTPTEVEQDSVGMGPISSALIRVRNAADIFAKVPLLSSYANSVSWFSDIGASAAKAFGWRKPISLQVSQRVTQNYLPFTANTDGPDLSFPLSLSYENSVGLACGFSGTDVDEMDFSYIATIPAYNRVVTWSVGQAIGSQLININVTPAGPPNTTTVNTQVFAHLRPAQLIANHFTYWRGSMVYKLKFVKTEFHSGRLMVAFHPYPQSVASLGTVTLDNSAYLHRQIIDVRETNEFTFVVPFVSDQPYKSMTSVTGAFVILIMEPLVAPATVTQSVSLILEIAAGPDIEFAFPTASNYSYYSGITPQSGSAFSSTQIGSNVCSNLNSTIGSAIVTPDSDLNALNCIGEKITSLRSLLKLPDMLVPTISPTAAFTESVLPYAISSGTVVTTTNLQPSYANDLYARFACCYVYSRGGVRLKFVDNQPVTATEPNFISITSSTGLAAFKESVVTMNAASPTGTLFLSSRNNTPNMYYKSGYSGEVQVPQYSLLHSRVNSDCVANATDPYNNLGNGLAPPIFVFKGTLPSSSNYSYVLRSLSDDGNFGGFISVPPMLSVQY
jgi:hypothetical protein